MTNDLDPGVLAWARWRSRGPQCASQPLAGMAYVANGGPAENPGHPEDLGIAENPETAGDGWLLGTWPDGATPSLVAEYDVAPVPVERAGETRRVLAATLRCCWVDLDGSPWPGVTASVSSVATVFSGLARGPADLLPRWALGALRRLHDSGWVLLDETTATVRLGPRVATWPEDTLTPLRETLRRVPLPTAEGALPTADGETTADASPVTESP
ncbi:hypothetical protein [Actinopolymorpha alba]|uniref:hypothetical protein n=1 Tax=Actinopolymorpha alba TaxID=533267 RepID=UPI00035D446D|nr:hypothetical protein [Actinopolymorpha alba]